MKNYELSSSYHHDHPYDTKITMDNNSNNESSSQVENDIVIESSSLVSNDTKNTSVEAAEDSFPECNNPTDDGTTTLIIPTKTETETETTTPLQDSVSIKDITTTTTSNTTISTSNPQDEKVKIHFVAVGSAPIMKKSKFQISSKEQFSTLIDRLSKILKLSSSNNASSSTLPSSSSSSSSLFLYINSSFVPSPEENIGDLHKLFSIRGELQIHYSLQEAWG